jgi:uncharacterized protein with HEPN domain
MPRDETYLIYMLSAARRVTIYMGGLSRGQFDTDQKSMDAIALQLGNIGEAANQISPEFQRSHPEIPWPKIVGMRNRIFHRYVEIDWDIVWVAATEEVPELTRLLQPIVPPEMRA